MNELNLEQCMCGKCGKNQFVITDAGMVVCLYCLKVVGIPIELMEVKE